MKKINLLVIGACFLLMACGEDGKSTEAAVDSTINKLDAAAEKVGEKAEEGWDTVKSKAKDVKESLDKRFDDKEKSDQ